MLLTLHYIRARLGARIRHWYYARLFKKFGSASRVLGRIRVTNPENIEIGDRTTLNEGCFLNSRASIRIGNDVHISQYAIITTTGLDVPVDDRGQRKHNNAPIIIEDSAWIGAHAVILQGVTIGACSIVGAGAVVTKDILPHTIAVGVPARNAGQVTDPRTSEVRA